MPYFVDVPDQRGNAGDHSEKEPLAIEPDKALDENLLDGKVVL